MSEKRTNEESTISDRRLGDEWADWDGQVIEISADTDGRVFIGLAFASIVAILAVTALFLWLIYPRINQLDPALGSILNISYLILAAVLIVWLILFIGVVLTKRPFLSTLIVVPKLVNILLEIALRVGRFLGISRDRMFNSFLKLHNFIISSDPKKVLPEKLLLLLPRCLSREMRQEMRNLSDQLGFLVAAAGGGGEARRKIRELRPGLIIAVACERDLLSGFIEVNPHIPVIGFPNIRPCGPCKDTEVDLETIEATIKKHLSI